MLRGLGVQVHVTRRTKARAKVYEERLVDLEGDVASTEYFEDVQRDKEETLQFNCYDVLFHKT